MTESSDFDFKDSKEICKILNTVTRLDIQLLDNGGKPIFQIVKQKIPVSLENFQNDNLNICDTLKNNMSNNYYHYINSYSLEYICCGIYSSNIFQGAIAIGPFISFIPTTESISDIMFNNKLPISERTPLTEFYKSLSVLNITNSNDLGSLVVNLCSHPYIYPQLITSEIINSDINREELTKNIAETQNIIEARYEYEKKIVYAVMKGNKEEANNYYNEASALYDFTYRMPENPIRSTKDSSFTFNTLLRIAAQRGGVHPVYIHSLSEKFAIMIEKSPNIPYLQKLMFIMLNEYCDLVKTFSTIEYSPIVKNAVDYINLNLGNPLTLQLIADEIHVNTSHLSRKFKMDTNMTVIDYINTKKVEEAKLYLDRGKISFTDIALMVGFNDLNYFGRVFKKITSLTPSEYVKKQNSSN